MEKTDNMAIWNKVAVPPLTALKQITAGRMKGKTDISPQWRLKILTEVFGPCGVGWKSEIKRTWTEPGSEGQVLCFVEVALYFYSPDVGDFSDPIPAIGGAFLIKKEKNGMYCDDDAFKKAETDALGKAAAKLGVAATVYEGDPVGSKYQQTAESPSGQSKKKSSGKGYTKKSEKPSELTITTRMRCGHIIEKVPEINNMGELQSVLKEIGITSNDFPPPSSEEGWGFLLNKVALFAAKGPGQQSQDTVQRLDGLTEKYEKLSEPEKQALADELKKRKPKSRSRKTEKKEKWTEERRLNQIFEKMATCNTYYDHLKHLKNALLQIIEENAEFDGDAKLPKPDDFPGWKTMAAWALEHAQDGLKAQKDEITKLHDRLK